MDQQSQIDADTGSRILIVDDEESIRESIAMILEFEGYATDKVEDGLAARKMLQSADYDAVILDVKMPRIDGLDILRWIGEKELNVATIMVSGHADINDAVEALRLGAYDFLEKPLQKERVLLTLRNALASKRLADENRALRSRPFSPEAEEALAEEMARHNSNVIAGAARLSKRSEADAVSAADIRRAAAHLVSRPERRIQRWLGVVTGAFLGASLSALYAMLSSGEYTALGVLFTVATGMTAAFGLSYHVFR